MHENPIIYKDYIRNDYISNNHNHDLYRKISLPKDYSPFEIQLISKVSELFPVDFDWLTRIPFRRDCTVGELSSIEQGLNSNDLEQRKKALFRFINFKTLMEQEMHTIEVGIRQKMQAYYDLAFDDDFKQSLDEMIHQVTYEEYLERTKLKIEQYVGKSIEQYIETTNSSEENKRLVNS